MAEQLAELIKTKDLNIKQGHITKTQTVSQASYGIVFDVPFNDADYDVFLSFNDVNGYFLCPWVINHGSTLKTANGFSVAVASTTQATYNISFDLAWIAIHR